MKTHQPLRLIGCGILTAFLIISAVWFAVAFRANEQKNWQANVEYRRICREDALLDEKNKQKWEVLKRDVQSGRVDSRDLDIKVPDYQGPSDKYKNILGPVEPIGKSGRLFRQEINLKYRGSIFITLSDVIVIEESFINFYSIPFSSRSCYGDVKIFNQIVNYHQY